MVSPKSISHSVPLVTSQSLELIVVEILHLYENKWRQYHTNHCSALGNRSVQSERERERERWAEGYRRKMICSLVSLYKRGTSDSSENSNNFTLRLESFCQWMSREGRRRRTRYLTVFKANDNGVTKHIRVKSPRMRTFLLIYHSVTSARYHLINGARQAPAPVLILNHLSPK